MAQYENLKELLNAFYGLYIKCSFSNVWSCYIMISNQGTIGKMMHDVKIETTLDNRNWCIVNDIDQLINAFKQFHIV